MAETVWRYGWFIIVSCAIAYACFLVAGSIAEAQASDEGPVVIRDTIAADSHELSGMILVPSPCDELISRSEVVSNTVVDLLFSTWQEPSVDCTPESTPRYFRMAVFAPAVGVDFIVTLDGKDLPAAIEPVAPSGL